MNGGQVESLDAVDDRVYVSIGQRVVVLRAGSNKNAAVISQAPLERGRVERVRQSGGRVAHDIVNRGTRFDTWITPFWNWAPRVLELADESKPQYLTWTNLSQWREYRHFEFRSPYLYTSDGGDGVSLQYVGDGARAAIASYHGPRESRITDLATYEGSTLLTTAVITTGLGILDLVDVSQPVSPSLLGRLEIPGLPLLVTGNTSTAYVYATGHDESPPYMLDVVDITDPANPRLASQVALSQDAPQPYVYWTGRVAAGLVATNGVAYITVPGHGLTVVDARDPNHARVAAVLPGLGNGALAINGNWFYAAQNQPAGNTIRQMDISDPLRPSVTRLMVFPDYGDGTNMLLKRGNILYARSGGNELRILDVSDPAAAVAVGRVKMACCSGAAHPVYQEGKLYWPDGARVGVVDVTDPTRPRFEGVFDGIGTGGEMGIIGRYGFVADIDQGLQVFELDSFPATHIVATLSGLDHPRKVLTLGTTAYVISDVADSLPESRTRIHVVDASNPASPIRRATIPIQGFEVIDAQLHQNELWLVVNHDGNRENRTAGTLVYDLKQPLRPQSTGRTDWGPYLIYRMVLSDNYAMVWGRCETNWISFAENDCLRFCDITSPKFNVCPEILDIKAEMFGADMANGDGVIYAALPDKGIHVLGVPPLSTPTYRPDRPTAAPTRTPGPRPTITPEATERSLPLPFMTVVTPTPPSLRTKAYLPSAFGGSR